MAVEGRTVSVRQDDVGTLPSQLQRHLLQVGAAGGLLDQVTHLVAPSRASVKKRQVVNIDRATLTQTHR